MQYLDGKTTVTHIIASSLTPKKAVEFKRYRIVKPAWVVESVKAGKLLPWDSFRVLDEGAGQRVIGFSDGKVVNEVSIQNRGYKDQTDTSWYTEQLKSGTPRQSGRPSSLTQVPTPDEVDEVDELPQSTPNQPGTPRKKEFGIQSQPLISPLTSPLQQQTPQLLRDLRGFSAHDFDHEPDASPSRTSWKKAENYISEDRDEQSDAAEDNTLDLPHQQDGENAHTVTINADVNREVEIRENKRVSEEELESPQKRTKLTAEEHNEILLADPRIRKSSVVNPDFLEQYYRESRLHHLSAWKSDLKSQMQALAEEKSQSQIVRQKRPAGARRYILHVDFDSFFAAISLKKHPQYIEKPVAIAHGGGNGSEIASCNYPARRFGVTNGMWMKRAHELCPELKVLPYDFPAYEEASTAFYESIIATGGLVQSVSIDEALVDVSTLCFAATGSDGVQRAEGTVYREQEAADNIAQKLRDEVKMKTECDVSVGIGGNILLAKVALRKAKPAGQHQIRPEEVLDFIGQLEVTSLPGVAYSIGGKLEEIGIKFVKDIREFTKEKMMTSLGPKTGEKLWDYARGIDRKEVADVEIRKSVSAEVNWGVRFYNQEQVDEFFLNLCGELTKRLIKERVKGKQLSLKIMKRSVDAPLDPPKNLGHGKCDTYNRSVVLGVATNVQDVLTKETLSMLKALGISPGELRGIGVQMTRLEPLKAIESSQRKLLFKVGEPKKAPERTIEQQDDPIEDVTTPKKPRTVDKAIFGAVQLNENSPSRKPLNIFGTQFILPSQVDPAVLAELPLDIRNKLAQHVQSLQKTTDKGKTKEVPPQSTPRVFTALPAESQLDPEILDSLPEDVRSEIMAFYTKSPSRPKYDQAVLPQSPRKNRTVAMPKRPFAPAVRRRGRPGRFDVRSNANNGTLTQSNFIATRLARQGSYDGTTTDTDGEQSEAGPSGAGNGEMDPDFLAALPEDIRREVLDEQRRARLEKTSKLTVVSNARKKAQARQQKNQGPIERLIKLPPRPPKPTFTGRNLNTIPELREAISEWVLEFRDEGPYKEDTDALATYLRSVIADEGDMNKAMTAVKWLAWVVEEELGEEGDAMEEWVKALVFIKDGVQKSVKERGLGMVRF